MERGRRIFWVTFVVLAVLAVAATFDPMRGFLQYLWVRAHGGYTVSDRLEQFGGRVEQRLHPVFDAAGVPFPPSELALVAFKDSKTLEMYAKDGEQPWRFLKAYEVLAASGKRGPKLLEGDHQVPEGVYRVEALNPNSRFHVALRLDYPNAFDRRMAEQDGRTQLGSDIMIHGSSYSVGCLAMGDDAAEELFMLSALVERENVRVVISPTDFRSVESAPADGPAWIGELYGALQEELRQFKKGT